MSSHTPGSEDHVYQKVRAICLALPDSSEEITWGHPTFRVGKARKIFCGYGAEGGRRSLGFKCEHDVQAALVASDPRFTIAAYVGKHGWVSFRVEGKLDWGFLREAIAESYRQVAPAVKAARPGKPAKAAKAAPRTRAAKPAKAAPRTRPAARPTLASKSKSKSKPKPKPKSKSKPKPTRSR